MGHDRTVTPTESSRASGRGDGKRHRGRGRAPIGLDDASKAIIEHLQADGRRSYATIARSVGLSEAAVRQRAQKMVDAEVMQIVAVTDPVQVGFDRQAMIGVRANGDLEAIAEHLSDLPEVDYVVTTAGSFDFLVEVVCQDDQELLELIARRIRTIAGVTTTETFVYLKLNKQRYNWGTR